MGMFDLVGRAFRNLFESEADRRLRRQQAIAKTEAVLEKARKKYQSHAHRYRQKAIEALRLGSQSTYERFKRDMKRCIGAERRIAQLELAFAGAVQRAEELNAVREFCQGMAAVSRTLQDAMKGMDLSGALKNFSSVVAKTQDIEASIDQFLTLANQMSMSDEVFVGGEELVTDEEIDSMLRREAAVEGAEGVTGLDAEISKEMQELDKLQKELGGS